MANYSFSLMTPAQALAFDPLKDSISSFTGDAPHASVTFDDPHQQVTVSDGVGHTLVFGSSIYDISISFPSLGGRLVIGSPAGDFLKGAGNEDGIYGGAGNDTLVGGNSDVLSGGPGSDYFDISTTVHFAQFGTLQSIADWEPKDVIHFGPIAGTASNYLEMTASADTAQDLANQLIAGGSVIYVAVAVGPNVTIYADVASDKAGADNLVTLTGRTLADIDFTNLVGGPTPTAPPPGPMDPTLPPPLLSGGGGASGFIIGNIDSPHLGHLRDAAVTAALPGAFELTGARGDLLHLGGFGFTYDAHQQLTGGELFSITFIDNLNGGPTPANLADPALGVFQADLTVPFGSVAPFVGAVEGDTTAQTFIALLSGNDQLNGSTGADLIRGYDGADILGGGGGADTLYGGAGNDIIRAGVGPDVPVGQTYLRGEDGDDYITGGDGFDDINGNMGDDTLSGGLGDDWVVGGKNNDLQFGDNGADIVWGNLGNDTLVGGNGADQVRGGQGDDVLYGGAGDDYVSGDRGNDTITGGAGADLFHTFSGAGIDRALDFHISEGDRVMLDPGTVFTVAQVGADTVIDMGNGDQLILVGVQMSTLTPGWIFGA